MPCTIVALLLLHLSFLSFGLLVWTRSRPYGLCHCPYTLAHIKGFGSPLFAYLCLLAFILYTRVNLYCSRLCHVWHPQRVCSCVVTFDAHKALFRCNHLGCISDAGYFVHTFPLFCSVRWCAYHACLCHPLAFFTSLHACLHVHAWVLLVSVSSILQHNEAMDVWSKSTFVPRKHHLLFALLLVYLFVRLLAFLLCLPCLSYLSALCLFHILFASLLSSLVYWFLVFAFACTYMERGCLELGHGLLGASEKGAGTSMSIWAKWLQSVDLGV